MAVDRDSLHIAEARYWEARAKVVRAALEHAGDHFVTDPADPGWQSEVNEELLDDAIKEAAAALNVVREIKHQLERPS